VILAENIYEAMLSAAVFATLHWLAMVVTVSAVIIVRKRIGTLMAVGLIVIIAVTTWFGSIWLANQCVSCNYVDRIYQTEIRWGFLFWQMALLGILLALQAFSALRAKRIEKGI
jgi:hypothetical protein